MERSLIDLGGATELLHRVTLNIFTSVVRDSHHTSGSQNIHGVVGSYFSRRYPHNGVHGKGLILDFMGFGGDIRSIRLHLWGHHHFRLGDGVLCGACLFRVRGHSETKSYRGARETTCTISHITHIPPKKEEQLFYFFRCMRWIAFFTGEFSRGRERDLSLHSL